MNDTRETTYYYAEQHILPPEAKTHTRHQSPTLGQKTQVALASKEANHLTTIIAVSCLALAVVLFSMNKAPSTPTAIAAQAAPTSYNVTNHYNYAAAQPQAPSEITIKLDDGGMFKELASSMKTMFSSNAPTAYAPPPNYAAPPPQQITNHTTNHTVNIEASQHVTYNRPSREKTTSRAKSGSYSAKSNSDQQMNFHISSKGFTQAKTGGLNGRHSNIAPNGGR